MYVQLPYQTLFTNKSSNIPIKKEGKENKGHNVIIPNPVDDHNKFSTKLVY